MNSEYRTRRLVLEAWDKRKDEGGMMNTSHEFLVAHGEDFPGETFRVLKEKDVRLYGEYRTSRLVLEAWDKLQGY